MGFIKLFIESTKPKIMVQKNMFYFLVGYFISVFYYQQFSWMKSLMGLLIFVVIYSCVYVVNDIFDYKRDRKHPIKKHRPIPSHRLNPGYALLLCLVIYIAGFLASAILINSLFALCMFLLIAGNVMYSHPFFKTKKSVINSAIFLWSLQYLKLLTGWSVNAGEFSHPILFFMIPACLYLYSALQLAMHSDHYKGRFKIARKERIISKTLMLIPAVLITILLFTELVSYIVFIIIPMYLAFLYIVNKLKLKSAINKINKYMSYLNSLFVSLNLFYYLALIKI